eukprot:12012032-Karenia_brevis.AAC.1
MSRPTASEPKEAPDDAYIPERERDIYIYIYRRCPRGEAPPPATLLEGLGIRGLAFVAHDLVLGLAAEELM